ncbi:MAG TPA: ABC transporter permease [Bryobacteraceae bacterium]|nr:ABC transporter permease [Bryobacteraceae bacterium]
MLDDLFFRARALFRRNEAEADLDGELQFHLAKETEKYEAAGMPRAAAIRRARLALGGLDQTKEICRDARGVNWVETMIRDIRDAVRSLLAQPLFSLTVIVSLALGIGANVAIYSLLRVTLWKPLPVEHPDEIVHLERVSPDDPGGAWGYSYVLFHLLRDAAKPGGDVVAESGIGWNWFGLNPDSRERAVGTSVSGNFFSGLNIDAFAGRLIHPDDDDVLGGRRIAVLSYDFWTRRFQSDRSILGRTVYYREIPYTVVGIAPPRFTGIEAGTPIDIWVPISTDVPIGWLTDPLDYWLRLLARIPPGTDTTQIQTRLDNLFRSHLREAVMPTVSPGYRSMIGAQHLLLRPARAGLSTLGRRYEEPLLILLGSVVLILLICCANVANLILARNRARQVEIAVRRALGASRGRIASRLFAESLLLALAGTAAGLLVAANVSPLLIALLPASNPPISFNLRPDAAVLGFAAVLGLGTALIFGVVPAFRASEAGEALTLKSGSRVSRRSAAGKSLVAAQLALSLVLMISAGLFLDTVRNMNSTDLGFQPEKITAFDLALPKDRTDQQRRRVFNDLRNRLNHMPRIVSVSWAWPIFYGQYGWSNNIVVEGRTAPGENNETGMIAAGPELAAAMGIRLLQGRFLNERDVMSSARVAVVNESFARRYFGTASPLGGHVAIRSGLDSREIVGVVGDVRHQGPRNPAAPEVYVPVFQGGNFLVRSDAGPAALATLIRRVASEVDKSAQISGIRPYQVDVEDLANRERMIAALSTAFGGLALLLSAVGLFGVMAYSVARRVPELGIRLALGAQRSDVQFLILKETLILVVLGTAIGSAVAFASTSFVKGLLYGVTPVDPWIFAGAAVVLALVAGLAGFLPAWRASRIDPVVSLKYE